MIIRFRWFFMVVILVFVYEFVWWWWGLGFLCGCCVFVWYFGIWN